MFANTSRQLLSAAVPLTLWRQAVAADLWTPSAALAVSLPLLWLLPFDRVVRHLLACVLAASAFAGKSPPENGRTADGWIRATVVERRYDPGADEMQLRLRVQGGPEGVVECLRGRIAAAGAPPLGAAGWFRAEARAGADGGPCPWVKLLAEPAGVQADDPTGSEDDGGAVDDAALRLRRVWTRGELPPGGHRADATLTRLRDVGLGHLLAISGLHIGMLIGLTAALSAPLFALIPWRRLRSDRAGLWGSAAPMVGLAAAAIFVWNIGAPASAVRAVAVGATALVAMRLLGRRSPAGQPLLVVTLLVALVDPAALATPGLELSLTAVAWLTPLSLLSRRWRTPAAAVLPWLGTAPALAAFASVPWAAPIANLVGLPLFALWVFPAAGLAELATAVGLTTLSAVADDAYRWGLWLLDRLAAVIVALWPARLDIEPWPAGLRLAWACLPIVATRVLQGARRRHDDAAGAESAAARVPCSADNAGPR